jgi:Rnl2 family RNA ligase
VIPFLPYPKIVDTPADWGVDEAQRRRLDAAVWVATEKIHGANLCICTDGEHIAVAKRRAVLAPSEPFFDYRSAIGPLVANVRALFRELDGAAWALIYGELFGGSYPHPDVAAVEGVRPVQTGVHYCPDLRFAAFDLVTVDAAGSAAFAPFAVARQRLEAAGIPVVPVLGTGTLAELLALPVEFPTRLPGRLGLPVLADNHAEGMVLRPRDLVEPRPLLKRKREEFAEAAYHEARRWALDAPGDALDHTEAALMSMLTANRVHGAISKVGQPDEGEGRFDEIVAEVMRDLRDELDRRHGELVLSLSREDASVLWSVVEDEVTALVADCLGQDGRLDAQRYHAELAWAFLRGRLPDAGTGTALLAAARAAGLRWNKFKRKDGPPRVTKVLSVLEGIQPATLLDIGSGRGAFLWPLVARFEQLQVTAVDRLSHRVRDIEAVRAGGIARVRGQQADVTALPFADASFDVVTILEVLEHLEDPAAAAAEVMRVASRFVVASVPSHEDDNPEHIRLFTRDSLTALFEQAGAARVQISYVLDHMIAVVARGHGSATP